MSELRRHFLSVGAAVDSPRMPAWAASLLERIAQEDVLELVVVLVADRAGAATSALPALYNRLDRRLFATGPDAEAPVEPDLGACPVVSLSEAASTDPVGTAAPDVVVWLGAGRPPAIPVVSGAEVWWLDSGDPPFIRQLATGSTVAETRLLTHSERGGHARVVGRIVTSADSISLRRVRDHARWQTVELVLTCLRKHGHAPRPVEEVAIPESSSPGAVRGAAIAFRVGARATRRRTRTLVFDDQWVVAYRRRTAAGVAEGNMQGFTLLRPPPGRSHADPFLASHDGRRYIFFEDQVHGHPGSIARVEVLPDWSLSEPQTVLRRDYHLAYPLVFRQGEEWFMLPDSAANRTIELYRAVEFPDRWELDRVLLEGAPAFDTTPFEHDGRTWIFTTLGTPRGRMTDTVSLFHADSLTSPWTEHPRSPVVNDARHARPAGRIIVRDGRLLRPAQDCSARYGYALVLNEIAELTPEAYREVVYRRIEPSWLRGAVATHHYDSDDELEVVDARVRVPRWRR